MAATIPTEVPGVIRIGDTVKFTRAWGDYLPADSWTLTFYMVRDDGGDQREWDATDNGDGTHLVTIAATGSPGSDDLTAGTWEYVERVSKSGEVYTLASGRLEVLPNLTASIDRRTHAKKVLDALNAAIEGRASNDQLSLSIGDRSISRMSLSEQVSLRDKYKAEVLREEQSERIANGLGHKGKIGIRFV